MSSTIFGREKYPNILPSWKNSQTKNGRMKRLYNTTATRRKNTRKCRM